MNETKFVNRKRELTFLNESYKKKDAQLIIIYGRRRVGKTSMLLEFCKEKPHVYLLADFKTEFEQSKDFSFQLANELKDDLLKVNPLQTLESMLTYLTKIWSDKKVVVVIDEFPYLCKINPAFASILQKFWDLKFKSTKAFLVLCGSSVSMMEKETLLQQSPLYGRKTGEWNVSSLSFKHFLEFLPNSSFENAVCFYSLVGGIPEYIKKINETDGVEQNILSIIKKGSPLYNEVQFAVKEELTDPHNYFAIMKSIAFGKNKQNEIVQYTGLNKGMVSKYLSTMENLQFIKRIAPITEKIEKTRKGLYIFADNYFRFWFRFCFQFKSWLEEGKENILLQQEILPNLPQFISFTFEEICKEVVSAYTETVGSWWSSEAEIDIVGLSNNSAIFGECKWTKELVGMHELITLENSSKKTGIIKKEVKYYLFSKSGFTKELIQYAESKNNIELYDLKRLVQYFKQKD